MFYKYKNRMQRWWFDRAIRDVLAIPPVAPSADPRAPLVLSQLQHKDVHMYLAAIKSFARQVPIGEVHVIDDGSLTDDDRNLLARHVPNIHFHPLSDYRSEGLPRGGCWERLIAIAHLSETRYVIQLDADTLTLAPVDEVVRAAESGFSFSIGTWDNQTIESAIERARTAQTHLGQKNVHVQLLAEANFDRFEQASSLLYVRGCAGFSGFSAGPGKLDLMHDLSAQMHALIGARWMEWGSEQVMSNLVVANQPNAIVLPHPDYADCEKMQPGKTRFVHFIGTCRFRQGVYAERVRQTLFGAMA